MTRYDGRLPHQLRPISFDTHFTKWAEGSVLAKFGDTHVLCNVSLENSLPGWLKYSDNPHGWLTAEYAMLPRSTHTRTSREQKWPKGRTQEISRLIGRSLRMAVDLDVLGERTLAIDCDVLQADGGTRTAAITGAWIALADAIETLLSQGLLQSSPLKDSVAAVSSGIVGGRPVLDLDYVEDSSAGVDMNFVMTGDGRFVEVQGTAEKDTYSRSDLDSMLNKAEEAIRSIIAEQKAALGIA